MTCIAAALGPRGVVLGVDSNITAGNAVVLKVDKVVRCGSVYLAMCGNCSAIEKIQTSLPKVARPRDLVGWVRRWVFKKRVNGIAACGMKCVAWDDGSIHKVTSYAVEGAGWNEALGGMHHARSMGLSARDCVLGGLRAATAHHTMVAPPFTIVNTATRSISVVAK